MKGRCPTALLFCSNESGSKLWTKQLWGERNMEIITCALAACRITLQRAVVCVSSPSLQNVIRYSPYEHHISVTMQRWLRAILRYLLCRPALEACRDHITSPLVDWGPTGQSPNALCLTPNLEKRWHDGCHEGMGEERDLNHFKARPWEWVLSGASFTHTV